MAEDNDISYLDFDVSADFEAPESAKPKTAAIMTALPAPYATAAFFKVMKVPALVILDRAPNGAICTLAFIEDVQKHAPEDVAAKFTKMLHNTDSILIQMKFGRISTTQWANGSKVDELIPTLVLGGLTALSEQALFGELNLFDALDDLIKSGEVLRDNTPEATHALHKWMLRMQDLSFAASNENREIERADFESAEFDDDFMPIAYRSQSLSSVDAAQIVRLYQLEEDAHDDN
jgi:hypothetical protein